MLKLEIVSICISNIPVAMQITHGKYTTFNNKQMFPLINGGRFL